MEEPLDSRQLKAFVLLAKTGSYTETARQLYVTHSAISHAMRALESSVGCRLVSSLNKNIILTEAGETLLRHAEKVLEEMKRAKTSLHSLNKWGAARLRLAAETPFARHFLTRALVKFHHEFPRALVSLELLNTCDSHTLLSSNRADLILTEQPAPDPRFTFEPLLTDRFYIVLSPTHRWAVQGTVPAAEFAKAPFILHRQSSGSHSRVAEYLAQKKVVLNTTAEIDNLDSIKDFVQQTQAITILPGWTVQQELQQGTLVALQLGRKPLEQTWGFVHRGNHAFNHPEETLMRLCREAAARVQSEK